MLLGNLFALEIEKDSISTKIFDEVTNADNLTFTQGADGAFAISTGSVFV